MTRFEGAIEVGKAARNAVEHFSGIDDFAAFAQHVLMGDRAAEKSVAQAGDDFLNPVLKSLASDHNLATYSLPEALRHLRGDHWDQPSIFSGERVTNNYPMRRVGALINDGTLDAFGMPGPAGPELRFLAGSIRSQVLGDADRYALDVAGDRASRYRLSARRDFMHSHGYVTTAEAISGGIDNFRQV